MFTRLQYPIIFQLAHLLYIYHAGLLATAGDLFYGIIFTLYCQFKLVLPLFCFDGCIPSSALNTVLLVVLEHSSLF